MKRRGRREPDERVFAGSLPAARVVVVAQQFFSTTTTASRQQVVARYILVEAAGVRVGSAGIQGEEAARPAAIGPRAHRYNNVNFCHGIGRWEMGISCFSFNLLATIGIRCASGLICPRGFSVFFDIFIFGVLRVLPLRLL
jgi:hypothetical protein